MDLGALEVLLAELRHVRTDHQAVEAKRAGQGLPETTHETLSAFANTEGGGVLLLGVDERSGAFEVTGVGDPQRIQSDLQSVCALMEPPLRATIDLIAHPQGVVVAAVIPPVPRTQRPCHLAKLGAESGSFIRVGEGDQKLSASEVAQMLANRVSNDYSAAEAPEGCELDDQLVAAFVGQLRASNRAKYADVASEVLLRQFGAVTHGTSPTYAGLLTMGQSPQRWSAAATLTYRRLPRRNDPPDTRYSGRHLEGTVGELLDETLAALAEDLNVIQVMRRGQVVDELDVPRETLREVISNALIHRSLADGQRDSSILVEVSDEAVVVTSPGNLHVSADSSLLGLATISGVRNLSLVRLGEQLRTPSGARISEHQTSGIAAADRACHEAAAMPVLFVDRPTEFQAIMLRGSLDSSAALDVLTSVGQPPDNGHVRLLSVLFRLEEIREQVAVSGLSSVTFDARLAARCLAPSDQEAAAAELKALEDAGLLRRSATRTAPAWIRSEFVRESTLNEGEGLPARTATNQASSPAPEQKRRPGRPKGNRVPEVLAAIAGTEEGVLSAKGIGEALGLRSPSSRNKWIRRAESSGLIASSVANPFDPHGGYKLTQAGRRVLEEQASP